MPSSAEEEHLVLWGQVEHELVLLELWVLAVHYREHLVLWGQVEHGHKKAGHLGPAQCIY